MGNQTVHIKKFDNGQRTPAEVYRELGLGGRSCSTCDAPAAMRAHFYAPLDEFMRREPDLYALARAQLGGCPSFETTYGRMVRIETIYACDLCKKGLRQHAAHKPDWVLVEFDEMGLSEKHPIVVGVSNGG